MNKILSWSGISLALLVGACGGNHEGNSLKPSFTSGNTEVNIRFAEYDSVRNGYLDAFVYGYDGLGELPPAKVASDGSLRLELDLNGDAVLNLMNSEYEVQYGNVRIAPGETTDIVIYPDSVVTTGRFAELNRTLCQYQPKYSMPIFGADYVRYDMSGDEYTGAVLAKYSQLKDSLAADATLSPAQRSIEESAQLNSLLMFMSNRELVNRSSYLAAHPEAMRIDNDSLVNEVTDNNFASVIAAINPDSEALLGGDLMISNSLNGVDWSAKGAQGTLLGILSDYQLAAKEAAECRTDTARMSVLAAYSNPFFAEATGNIRNAAQKRFDDAVEKIGKLPDGISGDKIIEHIAALHKGKVVMVDLWNTWCNPCKAAIAVNEPLKSTVFSNPDIVWVYIADESSPMNLYVKQIPDIKGEHYRITAKQAEALHRQFDLDGIPYYILIERDGSFKGRPDLRDHDLYRTVLLKAVEK